MNPSSDRTLGVPLHTHFSSYRFSRGVEKARFPSEVHDALSYLEVARCHVNARKHLSEDLAIRGLK